MISWAGSGRRREVRGTIATFVSKIGGTKEDALVCCAGAALLHILSPEMVEQVEAGHGEKVVGGDVEGRYAGQMPLHALDLESKPCTTGSASFWRKRPRACRFPHLCYSVVVKIEADDGPVLKKGAMSCQYLGATINDSHPVIPAALDVELAGHPPWKRSLGQSRTAHPGSGNRCRSPLQAADREGISRQ